MSSGKGNSPKDPRKVAKESRPSAEHSTPWAPLACCIREDPCAHDTRRLAPNAFSTQNDEQTQLTHVSPSSRLSYNCDNRRASHFHTPNPSRNQQTTDSGITSGNAAISDCYIFSSLGVQGDSPLSQHAR